MITSTQIPDISNSLFFPADPLSPEDPTRLCQPSVRSQDCNASPTRPTTYHNTQKPYSPLQSGSSHHSADHGSQPSTDIVHQHDGQDGGAELHLPDQCLSMERSHDSSTCVNPTIPSAALNCIASDSTPAQTCVTDVQQSYSDTTVQLVSLECQSVHSLSQAHGSTSGGGRHHWHDTQQSSFSLISTHHHPITRALVHSSVVMYLSRQ
jgi:hypothetical protein